MRLYSYKMSDDTGFAPNPFFGKLTLATCKPGIRKSHKTINEDWIAGFTSKKLDGSVIGHEKLVYLMQVTDIVLIAEYFNDPRFSKKIPNNSAHSIVEKTGDNIYKPACQDAQYPPDFVQLKNNNHWDKTSDTESLSDKIRDISGKKVLISDNFYYFGRHAIEISSHLRPVVPRGQSCYGSLTYDQGVINSFLEYIRSNYEKNKIYGAPHKWTDPNDLSWKEMG